MSKGPTEQCIKTEAARLLVLANNPGDSTEVARALKRHARTDYHVRSIVQYLLDNQHFYPTPSAIRDAADTCLSEPPPRYRPPAPDCRACSGSGFISVIREGCSFAGVCECRKVEVPA